MTIVVRVLKDEFIPLVPATLPTVFKYLKDAMESEEPNKALPLATSCLAFVHALAEHLPFLLTGESLDTVLTLLAKAADSGRLKESRGGLLRLLAKNVGADEMFEAFERDFETVAAVGSIQVSSAPTWKQMHMPIASTIAKASV